CPMPMPTISTWPKRTCGLPRRRGTRRSRRWSKSTTSLPPCPPETGLNITSKSNPVAVIDRNISYVLRAFTADGCFDLDTINVQVFQTQPDIFVPNAFAPDGRNRELKPKAVGISTLHFFRVYNRWGQVVFQTTQFNKGWDGNVNGVRQANGTYVWMVSGTDYTGKIVSRKGTAVLIR
ncbi:MAG: hypothetical protein EOP49_26505, partial [Sphingobacteriales bacterium]